jgi:hypothetical protein
MHNERIELKIPRDVQFKNEAKKKKRERQMMKQVAMGDDSDATEVEEEKPLE